MNEYFKYIFEFGVEMINCIEKFHSLGYIHCDIKPENFIFRENIHPNQVSLIDFGLSHRYLKRDIWSYQEYLKEDYLTDEDKHVEYEDNVYFKGTPSFSSVNTH